MAARLWTALPVLPGVFVMHGAQCTAAAGHPFLANEGGAETHS